MSDPLDDLVLDVVARHMLVNVEDLRLSQRVHDDLDLDPLDLVLIALRLEDIQEVEFPIHALEDIEELRDFASVLRNLGHMPRAAWLPPAPRRDFGHPREVRAPHPRAAAGLRARRHA